MQPCIERDLVRGQASGREDRVRIQGKHWARTLESILARVAEDLGVDEPVAAGLYKLLVYDQGSFFVSHRDTEKAPGMFATQVIGLPSISAGGDLVVRHKDRKVRLELRSPDPSEVVFADILCRLNPRGAPGHRGVPADPGLQSAAARARPAAGAAGL